KWMTLMCFQPNILLPKNIIEGKHFKHTITPMTHNYMTACLPHGSQVFNWVHDTKFCARTFMYQLTMITCLHVISEEGIDLSMFKTSSPLMLQLRRLSDTAELFPAQIPM
ncbi:hypothetical protein ACJX0J_025114, partial [Zea mays]